MLSTSDSIAEQNPLIARFVQELELLWAQGCPIAGNSPTSREELATIAMHRISSFSRRGVAVDDRQAQINDLARSLLSALEEDAGRAGPLIKDYRHAAATLLQAHARNYSQTPSRQGKSS